MSDKTPYQILGLSDTATKDDAEKAWKKAVRELHPDRFPDADEEKKKALTLEMSAINKAWQTIRKGWRPLASQAKTESSSDLDERIQRGSEIPLFYSHRDPLVSRFIETIKLKDAKETQKQFFKKLFPGVLLGKIPRRKPLHVSLCAAVVIEGKVLTYMFHAPLPAGRSVLIVPQIKSTANGVNVSPNKPEAIYLHPKNRVTGTISPLPDSRAQALGLEKIKISMPSRTFDMTKSFDLPMTGGMNGLIYSS